MLSTILGHSVELCVLPSALVPLVLSKFLAEHVKGQFRLLILVAPCWMDAAWLPMVLYMLVYILHCYPVVQNIFMDVKGDWLLKGSVITTFNPGCSDICVVQARVPFLSVSGSGRDNLSIWQKFPAILDGNGPIGVLQRVYQMMPFLLQNYLIIWFTYLGLAFLGTVGINCSAISAFGTLSWQDFKSSYHLWINASFLLQYPLHINIWSMGCLMLFSLLQQNDAQI